MEKNCLVTTYKAAVNDNSLLKIGEMRLQAGTFTETYSKRINFTTYPQVIETLDGSASLTTDKNLLTGFTNKITLNIDHQYFYTKNQDVVIVVANKYDVKGIYCRDTTINLDDLKYSPNLTSLENVFCKGSLESIKDKPITYLVGLKFDKEQDIINFSRFSGLNELNFSNSLISGDISAISGLTALTKINLAQTNVSGDISAISGLTSLTNINLANTNVSGDISAISGLTSLTSFIANITSISGDISAFSGLTALTNINLGTTSVSGDIQSLGSCTALTFMELVNMPNMRGEIIDYVIAQRSHGRTSGNTRFGPSNTVKFNGKVLSGYNNFSWTESTITNETTSETVNR